MPMLQVAWLAVSAIVFVIWAWCMFRTLFALTRDARRAAEARGGMWPGPRTQWAQFRRFATDPAHRRARWQLATLTVGLLALNAAGAVIWNMKPP